MAGPTELLTITVDDREQRSGLPDLVGRLWPRVAVGRLAIGDVEIGPRVIVERKTLDDLIASLRDDRLFNQAYALRGATNHRLLIVEGTDGAALLRVRPVDLRGLLLSLLVGYGLPLLRTADVKETAEALVQLARQEQRRLARRAARNEAPPRKRSARVSREMLGVIPGVGDLRARRLLDRFGTAGAALSADRAELEDVPGIGKQTAKAVRRADRDELPGEMPDEMPDGVAERRPVWRTVRPPMPARDALSRA